MPRTLSLSQPDILLNPSTYQTTDASASASAITLLVKDVAGFNVNDYILIGKYNNAQAEIQQITALVGVTGLTISALSFPHSTDTNITKIDYNMYKVYRSVTGIGGSYSLLSTTNLLVDLQQSTFIDTAAVNPYSYQLSYYNSTNSSESDKSDEIPFAGFSFYTLKSLQDRVLTLFGDTQEQLLSRSVITDWINEANEDLQYMVMGGDSPYYLNSAVIQVNGTLNYNIASYSMEHIYLIEISYDGINYNDTVNPLDFRFNTTGEQGAYGWRLAGQSITIAPLLLAGSIRIWYGTLPVMLVNQGDTLQDPFKAHTRMYVNYALMRANEKDRKFDGAVPYYEKRYGKERDAVVPKLKSRIKAAGMAMATTWTDDYGNFGA